MGDDAGLAAARPGQDEERPFGCLNGVPLRWVQAFEDVHRVVPVSIGMEGRTFTGGRFILASTLGCFNAGSRATMATLLET